MATLYEITADLKALDDLLQECGGDISDPAAEAAVNEWMQTLGDNLDAKVDGYCSLIREIESRAAARAKEAERLLALARTDENASKGLKWRLMNALHLLGQPKIKTERFNVSICANGGKLPLILDCHEDQVPEDYRKVVSLPDLDAVRCALDAGTEIGFAHYGERGRHLRIK